jgi:hypothetical protein
VAGFRCPSIIATPSASSVKPAANGTKRERKLDDEDLARLRHLYEEGWTLGGLAEAFGISRQHAGRLVRGEQRPSIGPANGQEAPGGVVAAVEDYLSGVHLDRGGEVLAQTVTALARRLDACAASDAAAAAQSAPRIAPQMVDDGLLRAAVQAVGQGRAVGVVFVS